MLKKIYMVNPFKKNKVEIKKTFNYSKGEVTLDFSLTTPQQYKDFLECLKVAVLEVTNEIEK